MQALKLSEENLVSIVVLLPRKNLAVLLAKITINLTTLILNPHQSTEYLTKKCYSSNKNILSKNHHVH